MSPAEFCQWLQGCLDIIETKTLNTKQVEMIKEKLATVEGHQKSSLHAKKIININTPQQEQIYIPYPVPNPPHPDLGPYPTWQEKNPNWSGTMGQTNQMPLQTVLSPSTAFTYQSYYEHHSDIPDNVAVSGYVGTKPNIGTFENTLAGQGLYDKQSFTYSNIPIKLHSTSEHVSFPSGGISFGHSSTLENQSMPGLSHMVTASTQIVSGCWNNISNACL